MFLSGKAVFDRATQGERIADDSFLLLFNNGPTEAPFILPGLPWASGYESIINTCDYSASADAKTVSQTLRAGEIVQLASRSTIVLRASTPSE